MKVYYIQLPLLLHKIMTMLIPPASTTFHSRLHVKLTVTMTWLNLTDSPFNLLASIIITVWNQLPSHVIAQPHLPSLSLYQTTSVTWQFYFQPIDIFLLFTTCFNVSFYGVYHEYTVIIPLCLLNIIFKIKSVIFFSNHLLYVHPFHSHYIFFSTSSLLTFLTNTLPPKNHYAL